ncbi:MAG: pilus assembly protein TadG-related protein [Halothiobacillus sp.]
MKGQALILALITLVVLVIGVIVLFNTGQTVSKKVQLVNTADAAAYSVAVQQARAFNMIAYMNRATVANQVAMAQMVSWYSWTNFAISATGNLKNAIQVVAIVADVSIVGAPLGAALQEAVNILDQTKNALQRGRDIEQEIFNGAATAIANLDGAYAQATKLIGSTVISGADLLSLANQIVKLNNDQAHPQAHASIPWMGQALLMDDAKNVGNYVQRYTIPTDGSTSPEADRFANVVMEARDPFSRQRNGHLGFSALGSGLSLDKKGGTDLVDYRHWVGLDTLGLDVWYPTVTWRGIRTEHIRVPLAWGGAAAVDKQDQSFSDLAQQNPGWTNPYTGSDPEYAAQGAYSPYADALNNGWASSLVLSNPADGGDPWITPYAITSSGGSVGLPDYNDIKNGKAIVPYFNGNSPNDDVGPKFTVLVEESTSDVHTSSHIPGMGAGRFDVADKSVGGDKMTAISTAEVYFSRSRTLFPNIVDSHRELGSLFSPYWHARRIETPCAIRQAAAASYGIAAACTP